MKRFGLSAFVVFLFVCYSLYIRGEADNEGVLESSPNFSPSFLQRQNTTIPSPSSFQRQTTGSPSQSLYRNGTYKGPVTDAFYGNMQVQVVILDGKINDVQFLQYPNDRPTSTMINQQALPMLKREVIISQSAKVDVVSGATDSSRAFIESVSAALSQAKS